MCRIYSDHFAKVCGSQNHIYAAQWRRASDWAERAIKMGDYVIEEVVSTRCLGTSEVVYTEVELT